MYMQGQIISCNLDYPGFYRCFLFKIDLKYKVQFKPYKEAEKILRMFVKNLHFSFIRCT